MPPYSSAHAPASHTAGRAHFLNESSFGHVRISIHFVLPLSYDQLPLPSMGASPRTGTLPFYGLGYMRGRRAAFAKGRE